MLRSKCESVKPNFGACQFKPYPLPLQPEMRVFR